MSGYPNRPARSHFGPTLRNARPVLDSTKELGAQSMNLAFWQLAGAGRTLPMAVLLFDGAAEELTLQQLAFDPRGKLDPITTSRTSTGLYVFTFASSYPDESGQQVPWIPRAVIAAPQISTAGYYAVGALSSSVVTVQVYNAAGTAADALTLVQVW